MNVSISVTYLYHSLWKMLPLEKTMQGTLDLYVLIPTIVCVLQLSQNKKFNNKKETSEIKEQR